MAVATPPSLYHHSRHVIHHRHRHLPLPLITPITIIRDQKSLTDSPSVFDYQLAALETLLDIHRFKMTLHTSPSICSPNLLFPSHLTSCPNLARKEADNQAAVVKPTHENQNLIRRQCQKQKNTLLPCQFLCHGS